VVTGWATRFRFTALTGITFFAATSGPALDFRPLFRVKRLGRRASHSFPSSAEVFFSVHVVQTGSEVHPASYPTDTGGSFLGDKAAGV
jgi:hypothetical protein